MLLTVAGCALAQSPVDLVRAKKYAEARKVMATVPEPAETRQRIGFHRLKAAIASGLNEHGNAADEMAKALSLAPNEPDLLLAAAVAELRAGRLDKALAHASAVQTAAGYATVGDIQEKRREYLAAAQAYQKAVELAPDVEAYRVAQAVELVQHATFEPAVIVLENAVLRFPKSAKIRALLGVAQYALGNNEKAVDALLDAIAADPKFEPAYRYLQLLTLEGSGAPQARVAEALCGWDAVVCAAVKLRSDANHEESLRKLAADSSAVGRCEAGKVYEKLERWQDARRAMEACVKLSPTPQNHFRLGRDYQRLGLRALAGKEMAAYRVSSKEQSEEAARRQAAVQAFQFSAYK